VMPPDARPENSVAIEPGPHGQPPLLLVFPCWLRREAIVNMSQAFEAAYRNRKPVAIEGNPKVYQLIDGRWEALP
jgi:hypothetical protein